MEMIRIKANAYFIYGCKNSYQEIVHENGWFLVIFVVQVGIEAMR